ncbi:MAG: two pore domain potassium channel family protein, partial [Leptolyngbya sp. SIO4C5]|nr:two pore domain potassium channel family protein [Leptolyngbya sp. SIO4C5]
MQRPFRRIILGSTFFLLTVVLAVYGYMLAGWSLLDAVYMVVITIFGVGYGEVHPLDNSTKGSSEAHTSELQTQKLVQLVCGRLL